MACVAGSAGPVVRVCGGTKVGPDVEERSGSGLERQPPLIFCRSLTIRPSDRLGAGGTCPSC